MKKNKKIDKYDSLINFGLKTANNMEDGSQEKLRAIEYVERLQKLKLEEQKSESDKKDKWIDRSIKIGLALIEIGAPLALYAIFMNKGFEFEKEGTFTSMTFKNLIGRIGKK